MLWSCLALLDLPSCSLAPVHGSPSDGDETVRVDAIGAAIEIAIHASAGQSGPGQQVFHLLSGIEAMGELERARAPGAGHTDLGDSLAQEYADYQSISLSAARERLEESWRLHHQRRRQAFPTDLDPERLRRYYDTNEELGMEIGLRWHSLRSDPWALHSVAGL